MYITPNYVEYDLSLPRLNRPKCSSCITCMPFVHVLLLISKWYFGLDGERLWYSTFSYYMDCTMG